MSENKRIGDWSLTFTGRQIWPLDPRPEDFCIEDVAHHLSLINRFTGATRYPYSVAQHSVNVAVNLPSRLQLEGLMHDAAEYALGDMGRPLKYSTNEYRPIESKWWRMIAGIYGFNPEEINPEVKWMDNIMLVTERRDLMTRVGPRWAIQEHFQPLEDFIIMPWPAERAELEFLQLHEALLAWRGVH